ncbi:MAG TPA: DUF6644 family protein [Steroidobacteraceae bacterium]|nr:DUF6644 family protein [Steroidobacteraceae bacterium]
MFRPFADWLANTALSKVLQDQAWVVPTSQSIHIIAVSIVFGSACMINLRLLGMGRSGRSVSQLSTTLVPWMWRGLAVLLFTGLVQTITEPVRQFVTPMFWAKMLMIVIVTSMTAVYVKAVRRNAPLWDAASTRPVHARVFATMSTLLWLAIIVCGRFIGYTWSFYA